MWGDHQYLLHYRFAKQCEDIWEYYREHHNWRIDSVLSCIGLDSTLKPDLILFGTDKPSSVTLQRLSGWKLRGQMYSSIVQTGLEKKKPKRTKKATKPNNSLFIRDPGRLLIWTRQNWRGLTETEFLIGRSRHVQSFRARPEIFFPLC